MRRRENKTLRREGDDTLVGTKHLWRYGRENVPDPRAQAFDQIKGLEPQDGPRLGDQGDAT